MQRGPREVDAQDGVRFERGNDAGEVVAVGAGEPGPDVVADEGPRDGVVTRAAGLAGLAEAVVPTVSAAGSEGPT